jgi:hypothetical protein
LWILAGRLLRSRASPEIRFWRIFVPLAVLLGVATHGGRDLFGVTHVTLQPVVLLGVTLLAANAARLPRLARGVLLVGCVLDFAFGIALQHQVESFENTATQQTFDPDPVVRNDALGLEWRESGALSRTAWRNWYVKQAYPLLSRQLERATHLPPARAARLVEAVQPEIERQVQNDQRSWGGWFARHDRRVTFLGDLLAGAPANALRAALLAAIAAIVWMLMRRLSRRRAA